MSYHSSWDDAAFAEDHGFATAGFIDSPLIAGDPFVCMALAAERTREMRLGSFLAIPSARGAATAACAIATVNRIAPGRAFLGLGTGFTGRAVFGLPRLSTSHLRDYAVQCRGLLDGGEVVHVDAHLQRPIRFRHHPGRHVDIENRIPVYVGADGPRALAVAGAVGDGWIATLQYSNVNQNAPEVFAGSLAAVKQSAAGSGRSFEGAYTMYSACICVLEEGESAVSPRALQYVGAAAMMPFHAYADDPAVAAHLPPPIQDRLDVYEREVLSRLPVPRGRIYQEVHRGHLSHLVEGEAEVLTDEIVRMTTLTGTASEIVDILRRLKAAGLRNLTLCTPPHLTRAVVLAVEQEIMPPLTGGAS